MLSVLTGTAMSAADLARELGISHANASYHLRQLAEHGEVVVAGEQRIRGGTAKLYRYPHEAEGADTGVSATTEDRVQYARAVAQEVERRLVDRAPDRQSLMADLEGWVAPEAWERAAALVREASRLLHDANRPPGTEGTTHISLSVVAFRMTGGEQ
ncbi:helix-turn-helix transcriptional regulator [Nocardioides anomalus]|uniref:Helix-turn-helix transcriptional regulator n=2 Tax=Nocardioides anomalus TaxID=2712223 RepID=A0A6G6WKV2_9ACTN|nr:helix-turn-helix transcriptional regulator [Nocardioides anomalus]